MLLLLNFNTYLPEGFLRIYLQRYKLMLKITISIKTVQIFTIFKQIYSYLKY